MCWKGSYSLNYFSMLSLHDSKTQFVLVTKVREQNSCKTKKLTVALQSTKAAKLVKLV